jgi:hypothetical protein
MGARMKIAGGGALVVLTTVIAAVLAVGGPGIDFTCSQTFSDYFALSAAVNDTANSGQTLCVNTDMGSQEPITVTAAMSADTRVIAFPPTGTLVAPGFIFQTGSSHFTVEGFEFTGEKSIGMGDGVSNIRIVKNYAHDQKEDWIQGTTPYVDGYPKGCPAPKENIEILGNRIARIEHDGDFPHGYGVYGSCWTNLKINYNECDGGSDGSFNLMADCWEIARVTGFENIGSWIHDLRCVACGDTHTDGIQWWAGADDGIVRDNVIDGFAQNTVSPDGENVLIDNNLMVDGQGNCLDTAPNGSSGDIQPKNFTMTNNTIWDCGFFGWRGESSVVGSGRGNNVVTDNIFWHDSCLSAGLATATGNVTLETTCLSPSTNFVGAWTPNWGGTDAGDHPTYQATNLPAGYEDAGYRPAPYGPSACPC